MDGDGWATGKMIHSIHHGMYFAEKKSSTSGKPSW